MSTQLNPRHKTFRATLALTTLALLVGCGGGDGGNAPAASSDGGNAPLTSSNGGASNDNGNGIVAPDATTSTGYWTMGSYTYTNDGTAAHTVGEFPSPPASAYTVLVTAGYGNDGIYSGSGLSISFMGTGPGIYTVVPDLVAFATARPAAVAFVMITVGAATSTGAAGYTATSGQIVVTVDANGKPHISTEGPLTMTKKPSMDVLGGIPGSPDTMTLDIHDTY
jgi:hypothetical protein